MKKQSMEFSKKAVVAYFIVLGTFALATILLAYVSVLTDFTGSLGYLAYPFTALSAAGAIILPAYFSKSVKQNTVGGITYEAAKANNFNKNTEDSI